MTLIVDANGPESSRPGLKKVLAEADKHMAEANAGTVSSTEPAAAANGRAVLAAPEVGGAAGTAQDFAPRSDPARMKRTSELTGQAIREACKGLGKSVLDLVDQAEQEIEEAYKLDREKLAVARGLAENFDEQVNKRGSAQAAGIEEMLTGLSSVHTMTAAVLKHVTELTESYSQQQEGKAA